MAPRHDEMIRYQPKSQMPEERWHDRPLFLLVVFGMGIGGLVTVMLQG